MRKLTFIIEIIALCVFALVISAKAQTYTSVTATQILDLTAAPLAAGQFCMAATDDKGADISFVLSGGGFVSKYVKCTPITNGVIVPMNVPNTATTTPAGILYHITILDKTRLIADQKLVPLVQGTTWSFDTYIPAAVIPPPSGGAIYGPLTLNGALTLNASCTGCGGSSRRAPVEACDGIRTAFSFTMAIPAQYQLFWNGLIMTAVDDFNASGFTVTLVRPCKTGDKLFAYF